ncbi:MAG: zf-HC2 domain-containing protein [Gemmataceae bacterium]
MTCESLRDLLPLHAYGELPPNEATVVEVHLTACATCRAEFAAFVDVQRALAATPVPAVNVDAGRLLAEASARHARRWRRLAVASAAIAAGLLAIVASRLEVRVGDGQFVISWANREHERPELLPTPVAHAPSAPEFDARLRLLDDLTRSLAAEIDERDSRRVGEIAHLRARLDALQRLSAGHWEAARRDFDALYTAQFKPVPKGDTP